MIFIFSMMWANFKALIETFFRLIKSDKQQSKKRFIQVGTQPFWGNKSLLSLLRSDYEVFTKAIEASGENVSSFPSTVEGFFNYPREWILFIKEKSCWTFSQFWAAGNSSNNQSRWAVKNLLSATSIFEGSTLILHFHLPRTSRTSRNALIDVRTKWWQKFDLKLVCPTQEPLWLKSSLSANYSLNAKCH